MGAYFRGAEVVKLAEAHGWEDRGPGGNHPHVLAKAGARRSVPVRDRLENPKEVRNILKQLGIPKSDWPAKLK